MTTLAFARRVPAVAREGSGGPAWPEVAAFGIATLFGLALRLEITATGPAIRGLAILVALGAFVAAATRPSRMPLFLIAYLPYNHHFPVTPLPAFNLTNTLLLAAAAAWVSSRAKRRQRIAAGAMDAVVGVYVVFGFLGMVRAAEAWPLGFAIRDFKAWLHPVLFYLIVKGLLESRREAQTLLALILYGVFWVGLDVVLDGPDLAGKEFHDSRVGGILGQPNDMGAFMAYYGSAMLACFLRPPGRRAGRWVYLAGFALMVRAAFYTYSRGAYLSLAAAAATMLVVGNPLLLGVGGALAVVGGAGLLPESVSNRLTITGSTRTDESDGEIFESASPDELDPSLERRLMLWNGARGMIAANPLRGVGLGRFRWEIDGYVDQPLGPNEARDAHNAYLLTAAELGVPALLTMIVLLLASSGHALRIYFTRRTRIDRSVALALLGTVTAVCVSCMFGSRFSQDGVIGYYWVLLATLVVVGRLPRPDRKRPAGVQGRVAG